MKANSFQPTSASSSCKQETNRKHQFQQYGFALLIATLLYTIMSFYLFNRRGYYDLYIVNKIFAGVSAILLGIILLIGSGSRLFSFPDRFIRYRKGLGITAFFAALAHFISSFFFCRQNFPYRDSWGRFIGHLFSVCLQ